MYADERLSEADDDAVFDDGEALMPRVEEEGGGRGRLDGIFRFRKCPMKGRRKSQANEDGEEWAILGGWMLVWTVRGGVRGAAVVFLVMLFVLGSSVI